MKLDKEAFNSSVMLCKVIPERTKSYVYEEEYSFRTFVNEVAKKLKQQHRKFYYVKGEDYDSEKGRYYYAKIFLIKNKEQANKHTKLWI